MQQPLRILSAVFSLFGLKCLESKEHAAGDSAQRWNQQKHPKLLHGFAAHEDRGTEAARRVHAGSGDVNAKQVNGDESEADDQSGKARGRGLLRGAENHDYEEHGGDKLVDDRRGQAVSALVAGPKAVLTETAC